MRVLNRNLLKSFAEKHTSAKSALESWFHDAENSDWKKTQDIKDRYRNTDYLADNRVIFNIKGNHFRLVVKVRFEGGIVLIEWIGTHAEYSKKRF